MTVAGLFGFYMMRSKIVQTQSDPAKVDEFNRDSYQPACLSGNGGTTDIEGLGGRSLLSVGTRGGQDVRNLTLRMTLRMTARSPSSFCIWDPDVKTRTESVCVGIGTGTRSQ
ncbi:uncharacterized protein ARMOST_15314 [Armillaria ostoyae]|uniref:Uncharacterized protein n=1 Tax=Armillaria ostoyae TaxID=47428 RepID=A0A284RT49_ARMOS|nr:uncharacterized protein ARMOST_15314 [Armillaria ostoyae]